MVVTTAQNSVTVRSVQNLRSKKGKGAKVDAGAAQMRLTLLFTKHARLGGKSKIMRFSSPLFNQRASPSR